MLVHIYHVVDGLCPNRQGDKHTQLKTTPTVVRALMMIEHDVKLL